MELDYECSELGKQLAMEDNPEGQREILLAIVGTRSPSTVTKRVNALLHYYRWFTVSPVGEFLPLDESSVRAYVRHLQDSGAAPTEAAMSFMQAVCFAHYVLQLKGAEACMNSRRLQGSAKLELALKGPTRQARPLTVEEETTCRYDG